MVSNLISVPQCKFFTCPEQIAERFALNGEGIMKATLLNFQQLFSRTYLFTLYAFNDEIVFSTCHLNPSKLAFLVLALVVTSRFRLLILVSLADLA